MEWDVIVVFLLPSALCLLSSLFLWSNKCKYMLKETELLTQWADECVLVLTPLARAPQSIRSTADGDAEMADSFTRLAASWSRREWREERRVSTTRSKSLRDTSTRDAKTWRPAAVAAALGSKAKKCYFGFPSHGRGKARHLGGGGGDADEFCGEVAYSRTKYAKNSEIASEDTSASTEVVREAERERERHTYYWEWERKVKGALWKTLTQNKDIA